MSTGHTIRDVGTRDGHDRRALVPGDEHLEADEKRPAMRADSRDGKVASCDPFRWQAER
jgi:hypothetical protein